MQRLREALAAYELGLDDVAPELLERVLEQEGHAERVARFVPIIFSLSFKFQRACSSAI